MTYRHDALVRVHVSREEHIDLVLIQQTFDRILQVFGVTWTIGENAQCKMRSTPANFTVSNATKAPAQHSKSGRSNYQQHTKH